MKRFFSLVLVIVLGIIAVGMDVTLWNASRKGLPYGTTPIMGVLSRLSRVFSRRLNSPAF